ncbi:ATP-grasp domain-containing protein [Streptomyces sp. NPDC048606]|uniref:ATP-grasp domain-containing protein n=1 Tax=Streptomyces sp. NPDC048606 TaxID=3154726 RepID=UPI003439899A
MPDTPNPTGRLVVVDPYSSGSVLARRAAELHGLDAVAVLTPGTLPAALRASYPAGDFAAEVPFTDVATTAAAVEALCGGRPRHLICGSEPGVEAYDALAEHWGLRPNSGPSEPRRDKFLMQARLKEAGVPYIPHHLGTDTESIVAWCAGSGLDRYVLKPVKSFATDGVFFCADLDEVRAACELLFARSDLSGVPITEILVEERLVGPEFVVDSVSLDGEAFVVDMFRYEKETVDGNPVYRAMASVDVGEHPEVVAYVERALAALGIDNGPAHSELILTADGPVLIETGARMHGGLGPKLVEASSSHSLIDLTLASRVAPAEFLERTRVRPTLRRGVVECFLFAPTAGVLTANRIAERCGGLDSFLFDTCAQVPGDRIEKTVDLITSYGRVVLAHEDPDVLARDTEYVLALDRSGGLIEVRPED